MNNLINYIKDKIYYIMGATIIIIILLVVISSCSNKSSSSNTYSGIEDNMVNAARKYYDARSNNLPKEEMGTVKVTIGTLIEAELLKEVKDPKDNSNTCDGYVEVKKVSDDYVYTPFLTCKGNYEPKYLSDIIKNSKSDEYGNGVYNMDGEYVYRGETVKNFVLFNDQVWRIVKTDSAGNIALVFDEDNNGYRTPWDSKYNSTVDRNYGVTTDYLHTDIRKYLVDFYENNFSEDSKAKIVSKTICLGTKAIDEADDIAKECSVTREEKVGLLVVSDYRRASLDNECTRYDNPSCTNRNYFSGSDIDTWLLTAVSDNNYEAYYLSTTVNVSRASSSKKVYPVVYITKDSIVLEGDGTYDNLYRIK